MKTRRVWLGAMLAMALSAAATAFGQTAQPAAEFKVVSTRNTDRLAAYDVFELTFVHENEYASPHLDATIEVVLTTPGGKKVPVGGFLYGSTAKPRVVSETDARGRTTVKHVYDRPDVWKARLAPWETGAWGYTWRFTNRQGGSSQGAGKFECVAGRKPNPGFVRVNPANPFRWVFDNGQPYFPIGYQDGWGDGAGVGSVLAGAGMEGPFRLGRDVPLPPGPAFVRGPSNNPQNADVQFRAFSQCGFNLFRFSQKNASFPIERNLDELLLAECQMVDELLARARTYNFRIVYGMLGNQRILEGPPLPDNPAATESVQRFVKYSVDRWGASVDFWQILNEKLAHEDWMDMLTEQIRSADPYRHPISTSWQRPDHKGIEINMPHWYHRVDTIDDSDLVVAERAKLYKRFGKPVILGEHGNNITVVKSTVRPIPYESEHIEVEDIAKARADGRLPPGAGGTWDPHSALRMRVRDWTALFSEISFIYWNTSYARDGHTWNMWFGPQERGYVRSMQDFAYRLDNDVKMAAVAVSDAGVRAYALGSAERAAAYLWHHKDHTKSVEGASVELTVPKAGAAYWIDPATGAIVKRVDVPAGKQKLAVPAFAADIALLVNPAGGPPDVDRDGKCNDEDDDDDNDGVADAKDAFPLDPSEWADKDGDLIGDNFDADDDGDGKADDANGNGRPDHEELDFDGDGVPRSGAVPWDAFPLDKKEWRDTDGDGIGDNADTDDDGDGWSDEEELKAGTDPLRRESFPKG